MKVVTRIVVFTLFVLAAQFVQAQKAKPVYHPCFLMDSAGQKLAFIQYNASRIFTDTVDCKQRLLNKIAGLYIETKEKKYLDALSAIRQNPNAKVDELYTDIVKRLIEDDFGGFIDALYQAKGHYYILEKELVGAMNMIVGAKPLKYRYQGLLNGEIEKAKDKKDAYKQHYLEKLKTKIEDEKY